ncbi:MAG: cupredoxin domain-containing protein [Actinomycetota bacterium]
MALGVLDILLIAGIVATALYSSSKFESVSAKEGDVLVTSTDFKFQPDELVTEAGTISVHITNKDDTLHTFTIDDLNVEVAVPAKKETTVTFEADAGKFRFYCKPHAPDMDGTLTVN